MAPISRPPPSSSEPDARPPSQTLAPPASTPQCPKYPSTKRSSSSSSEWDSDSCSYSDSDSSADSDSPPPPKPAVKAAPLNSAAAWPVPPPHAAAAADSDSDSSAKSDSPPPPKPAAKAPPLNSAAARPVPPPHAAAAADSDSDSSAYSDSPPPPKPAAKSAPLNSAPATPAKRKHPAAADNLPSAKRPINRVCSTGDEITVFQGMLEIQSTHNSDPAAAIESFHGFTKENLNLEYLVTQLFDKIRRLIEKYYSNLKQSKNGANPSFSRQIWPTNYEQSDGEEGEFRVLYPNLMEAIDIIEGGAGIPAGVMRKSIEKLTPARVEVIEERWGKHSAATAKMKLERADLIKDLIKAVVG